jgi:acyl carrier protein
VTEKTAVKREDILETIRTELKGFEVEADDVKSDASFDSLGLDSLDLVELSVRIEDAYGIDIEEDDLKEVWTIDNAIDVVLQKLAAS